MSMKGIFITLCLMAGSMQGHSQSISSCKVKDLRALIDAHEEDVLVLNFWATFCKPCVAEMPHLIKICSNVQEVKVSLILVSVDGKDMYPSKLRKFLKRHHVKADVRWLDETDANYFCPAIDSSWGGSIPATLFVGRKTGRKLFVESELNELEILQNINLVSSE